MPRLFGFAAALAGLAALAGPASAWNKPGHAVTGAIAYAVLMKESPATAAKVVALLKQHPYFEEVWKDRLENVPEEDRDLYLFTLAARWPDDARDDHEYYPPGLHLERTHYINIPFRPEGQPAWVAIAPPEDINIFRGYDDNLARVTGGGPAAGRAVALCWVFHLIGDVHQPLHTATLFTTKFQREQGQLTGDRGGTRFYVRAKPGGAPISLHYYWDGLVLGRDRFQAVRNRAVELRNRPEFAKEKLDELQLTDFEKWAIQESFPLAKKVAYRDGQLGGSPRKELAPELPADYAETVQPVAERRAVLAGYRIAQVLQKIIE